MISVVLQPATQRTLPGKADPSQLPSVLLNHYHILRCKNYCPGCGVKIFTGQDVAGLDFRFETECVCVVVDGVGASGVELSNHSDCFASVNVSTHEINDIRGNDGNDLFCLSDSQRNDEIHGNISEPPLAPWPLSLDVRTMLSCTLVQVAMATTL